MAGLEVFGHPPVHASTSRGGRRRPTASGSSFHHPFSQAAARGERQERRRKAPVAVPKLGSHSQWAASLGESLSVKCNLSAQLHKSAHTRGPSHDVAQQHHPRMVGASQHHSAHTYMLAALRAHRTTPPRTTPPLPFSSSPLSFIRNQKVRLHLHGCITRGLASTSPEAEAGWHPTRTRTCLRFHTAGVSRGLASRQSSNQDALAPIYTSNRRSRLV